MPCTHSGPFTCRGSRDGWRWQCLTCKETGPAYSTETGCLMDFTRTWRRLLQEQKQTQ